MAKWKATCANSNADRSGVGKVKCRPAFGSTAQKTLAVPQRSYSLSHLASRPGLAGEAGRTSACSVTGFSSRQTRSFIGLQDMLHFGDVGARECGWFLFPHFPP